MVGRIVGNPILKGVRVRNKKMSRRNNKTGRRRSVDAPPEERLERNCPHLAFIDPERFDRVNALLPAQRQVQTFQEEGRSTRERTCRRRGDALARAACGLRHLRPVVPLRWPRLADHLMCGGATNTAAGTQSLLSALAVEKLSAAILAEITALPDYDPVLTELMATEIERIRSDQASLSSQLEQKGKTVDRELANIRASLRLAGPSTLLIEDLKDLESQRDQIRGEIAALDRVPKQMIAIPPLQEVKTCALHALTSLACTSPEFGRLMQRLIRAFSFIRTDCAMVATSSAAPDLRSTWWH